MTAPSALHQSRVETLLSLAVLAGLTVPVRIDRSRVPDVVRRSPDGSRLFLGDAKASETPRSRETARRLIGYLGCCRPYLDDGVYVRLAICHGVDVGRPTWRDLLCRAARAAFIDADRAEIAMLAADAWLSWIDLCGRARAGDQ